MALYVSHESSHHHDTGPHPENAGRPVAIEAAFERAGWPGLERVEAPAASREQLERVHAPGHITAIEEFSAAGGGMIDLDTAASPGSYEAALHAGGGAAHAAERLLAGDARTAICALRLRVTMPTAIARWASVSSTTSRPARHAIDACGAGRVLVLDWDVHHGNGTEAIFAATDELLTRASISGRSTRARGPRSSRARGRGGLQRQPRRSRPEQARRSSWRWSSTSWYRSPAHTSLA